MLFIIVVLWRLKSVERYFVAFKDRFLLLCLAGFTWNCDWPGSLPTVRRCVHWFVDDTISLTMSIHVPAPVWGGCGSGLQSASRIVTPPRAHSYACYRRSTALLSLRVMPLGHASQWAGLSPAREGEGGTGAEFQSTFAGHWASLSARIGAPISNFHRSNIIVVGTFCDRYVGRSVSV